jgi:shikimate kinase
MTAAAVALGGFMGTGKSTVGRLLARALALPFVDLDAQLVATFGPIPAQFEAVGEVGFREREAALLQALCDGRPRVLATGGGAWVDERNREALRRGGYHLVVLHAPLDVLEARVGGGDRPLWDDVVRRRYLERADAYADADVRVSTEHRPPDEVVRQILRSLGLDRVEEGR